MLQGVAASILSGHIGASAFPEMEEELMKCDRLISVAEHMAHALGTIGIGNVCAVANGIDVDRFHPGPMAPRIRQDLGFPPDAILVAHVSNLKPVKRAGDFIAAAERAIAQRPDLGFVVIGDGPDRAALERDCARSGLADRMGFAGWIAWERMADHYRALDMIVLPSATEGLPLACLEAMASGRVMIASDIPASRELIVDGETGFLFPMGDVDALTRRILWLADRPEIRRQVGIAARSAVAQRFTSDHMVEGYDRVLSGLTAVASRLEGGSRNEP
jgi:glycosyltransferase involved in cell wall biosynthesis